MITKKLIGMAAGSVAIAGHTGITHHSATPGQSGLFVVEMTEESPHEAQQEIQAWCDGQNLAPLAGPYAKLANLLVDALKDHKITQAEATGMALELAHVAAPGAEAKARKMAGDLVGSLINKLTGK